jgi:ABC-2 type transport system permease protein
MTATAQTPALTPAPSLLRRLYGLGSIFGKAVRDSRRATIIATVVLAGIFLGLTRAFVAEFDTPASRQELVNLINSLPPVLQGLAGKVVNVGTMGGYLQYKYGTFFPLVLSLWSIIALSGTLAGEAQRGSLEFLATTGKTRRRIALEKLAGHIVPLSFVLLVTFVSIVIAGSAYASLAGDEISVASALAYTVWLGFMTLAGGALAFALAPFIGRGAAAGIAGFVTFAGFILSSYQAAVPELAPLANVTWWGWTYNHTPLAGVSDWPPVLLVGVVVVVLLSIGVGAFVRRDIGITSTLPAPSFPRFLLGLGGPVGRAIAQNLGAALAWGLGVALFGLVLGSSSAGFIEQLQKSPQFLQLLQSVFPGNDYATPGGFLQLLFVEFGVILAGLAAATFVAGWASDENSGRLEMVLATPLARVRWALSGGLGMLVNVGVFVTLTAAGIGLGIASSTGDLVTPLTGSLILGVYAAAMVGIGMAVGGALRMSWAAAAVVIVVIMTWALQVFGGILKLPDVIKNLALSSHFGQPMVGDWNWPGVVAALVLAIGGILVGAWGFTRRDLRR